MKDALEVTILVVEDDAFARKSIARYLESQDYLVLEAANGVEALNLFFNERPDLVVSDLRMPEMDGLDLLARVVKESPDTPFLILSGMGTMNDSIEALRIGAWDYLTKPVHHLSLLEHAIEKGLERAMLLRSTRNYENLLEETVKERTRELKKEIVERKAVEQQLMVAKTQWERIVDTLPELVFLVDTDHRLLRLNKAMAELMGMSPAEAIGKNCIFCMETLDRVPGYCARDELKADGQQETVEFYEDDLGGQIELKVYPYYDTDDRTLRGSVHIGRFSAAAGQDGKME